ncbi:MAG TPA: Na+/H+ antiporter subunit E [Xanthomonadaceae bacterium]|nr:Na+/H+ antiporter subunit E [Xanthomonadaceae bacterium]
MLPKIPQRNLDRHIAWGVQVFLVLSATWLALDGIGAWPVGLAAALLGAATGVWLVPGESYRWRPLRLLAFLVWFVGASLRGGIDVAVRAFQPRLPIEPGFHDYPLSLPPGPPRTLMLSVVSLLPGTLSADLDPERNHLCVHCLAPEMAAGLKPLERRVARLFGVEGPP